MFIRHKISEYSFELKRALVLYMSYLSCSLLQLYNIVNVSVCQLILYKPDDSFNLSYHHLFFSLSHICHSKYFWMDLVRIFVQQRPSPFELVVVFSDNPLGFFIHNDILVVCLLYVFKTLNWHNDIFFCFLLCLINSSRVFISSIPRCTELQENVL